MSPLSTTIYDSVEEVPEQDWSELNCRKNVYFSADFLSAFETSNPKIDFKYVIVYKQDKAISLAVLQIIRLSIDVILKNIKLFTPLKRFINYLFCNKSLHIMFCGNVFLSGEHGIFFKKGVDQAAVLKTIALQLNEMAKRTRPLHAIFIKDFYSNSTHNTREFIKHDFVAMHVEPNLIVRIDPNWKTYEDYKNTLKSKYRIKVNKADTTSEPLTVRLFSGADFQTHKEQLQQLYENTIANANFNAQVLNLNTYIKLRSIYKEDFIVMAYFLKDQLVGFLSALANNNHLDAHFIGLDYSLNKSYAIYPRILNDYVRTGIEKGVTHINLGRTASEIKTTIGAKPESLTCYIRLKRPLINAILRPFINMVKIKDFKQHLPFKTKKEA